MKKKILIFTSSQGHISIAKSIQENLEKKFDVTLFKDRHWMFNFYTAVYRLSPQMFKIFFIFGKNKKLLKTIFFIFKKNYNNKFNNLFQKHNSKICICTFSPYIPLLEELSTKYKSKFINILTDPKTIHPMLISEKAAVNLAFDEITIKNSKKINPKANLLKSGWFVRSEYEQNHDKIKLRNEMNLPEKNLTFLIVSGSDGTTAVTKILPAILNTKKEVTILVACGNNKTMFKSMLALQKLAKKTRSKANIIPLAFTKKLYKYMQAADLVIGKAGPNTLFESVATLTPFFAITHISGQEDGNLDIIRDYNLGYVEENPIKASKILVNIIDNPKQLNKFQSSLKKLKEYNQKSKIKLLALIENLLRE